MEEIIREYGFKVEHVKVIRADVSIPESERPAYLGAFEKLVEYPADYPNGKLADGTFIRWETISTPDPDAWMENECFCEGFGFRPNGPRKGDVLNHGIYSKDLNGDSLDVLTSEMAEDLGIVVEVAEDSTNV